VDLIDQENWSASGTDFKGDAYAELLSKVASDKGSGAGQYFTPRDLIQAIVDVIDPGPGDTMVKRAHRRAQFVEDVARQTAATAAERLLVDDTATVTVHASSFESIHGHDIDATLTSTRGALRALARTLK
jgi:type I restriction enzyme M protein